MLGPFCKKHFTVRKILPIYENPITFVCSQWQRDKTKPKRIYFIYRSIIAAIFVVTWILSILNETKKEIWPIFLTNWGYTICMVQALLAVVMMLGCHFNFKDKYLKIYPVYWVLYTLATPLAFAITFMYWTVIYDAKTMKFDAINYFVHGNNSVLMMIDLWMVSHPIRILHFFYPAIFGFLYTFFSLMYYLAGGPGPREDCKQCIYKILNWDKPTTILTCLAVTVFLIGLHTFSVLIVKLRAKIYDKFCTSLDLSLIKTKTTASYVNEGISNEIV